MNDISLLTFPFCFRGPLIYKIYYYCNGPLCYSQTIPTSDVAYYPRHLIKAGPTPRVCLSNLDGMGTATAALFLAYYFYYFISSLGTHPGWVGRFHKTRRLEILLDDGPFLSTWASTSERSYSSAGARGVRILRRNVLGHGDSPRTCIIEYVIPASYCNVWGRRARASGGASLPHLPRASAPSWDLPLLIAVAEDCG